jgi:hypothetical protein
MHRRTGEAKTKVMLVLQGLQGKPVAAICHAHQRSQSPYEQWRDQVLAHAEKAFEVHQPSHKEARLAREKAKRNTLVGALTCEFNKRDGPWG